MNKHFIVKEVTCKVCKGYGCLSVDGFFGEEANEDTCPNCLGKGYVVDERDKQTGYTIMTL